MHDYIVSFRAPDFDEEEFHELLRQRFGVQECCISRPRQRRASSSLKYPEVKAIINSLLADGRIMTPSMMIDEEPRLDHLKIGNAVRKMAKGGEIRKIDRGLYMSPSYPEPEMALVEEIRQSVGRKLANESNVRALRFLEKPRDLESIQKFMGISRQGAGQRLKRLIEAGAVHRLPLAGKAFLYCTDEFLLRSERDRRADLLTEREAALLERLPLEGFVKVGELPGLLNRSNTDLDGDIENLTRREFVEVEELGGSRYVRITDAGRSESIGAGTVRLDPTDLLDSFGRTRGNIIRVLMVLGAARSREIRHCLGRLAPLADQVWVPQMIQHMRDHGLIETSGKQGKKEKMRRLTADGERIGRILMEYLPSPSSEVVAAWIDEGQAADAMRLADSMTNRRLSERSLSILRLLESTGESLTRKEIGRRIPLPFENEASVNQAVNSLELRGLVEREQGIKGGKGSPLRFSLTKAGKWMLRSDADKSFVE